MEDRTVIACTGIHHWFGPKPVLHDIDIEIIRGEIVALVGPSGCGKSTLLRAIVGTHPPRQGRVVVYDGVNGSRVGHEVRGPGRDRGIVYQRYSLFPNLTAIKNVAFGLMLDETTVPYRLFRFPGWRRRRRAHLEEAGAFLDKLGLGHAKDSYPHELSGGMRQRVAIAQALIMKPAILLLDEPFGALDEATREDLQRTLLTLYAENQEALNTNEPPPHTILMVTHELNEAIFVSDRVIGLSQYWDWKQDGHGAFPGATIVYDQLAPVFEPDNDREFQLFQKQKQEILKSTFDPAHCQERSEWIGFWDQVRAGEGRGILKL